VNEHSDDHIRPWTYYHEPTELEGGVGCDSQHHINDLDLAKHICDRYDECHWFDGDEDFGTYPGAMGRYHIDESVDTYIKKKWKVVEGSLYFPDTRYLNIGERDIWCNRYKEVTGQSITDMKKQCDDDRSGCDGFTLDEKAGSGFLCKWVVEEREGSLDGHVKIPAFNFDGEREL